MLKLTQINVFPVKSLDGYSPNEAIVQKRGLEFDRRWMIVDEKGEFFTQRTHRKMTLLKATIEGEKLVISEKNNPANKISLPINEIGKSIDVSVWDDNLNAHLVSPIADEFLSDFLDTKCHLVKMTDSDIRRVEEDYNTGEDIVSFADGFPYLIIGETSLHDLNSRLSIPLNPDNQPLTGMRRFRTNFVFEGGVPYEEENWSHFSIGEVSFRGIKPCGRCVMTTLNPDTGESSKEPLATLATYRLKGKKIPFGQNVIWLENRWHWSFPPTVKVGDAIHIE